MDLSSITAALDTAQNSQTTASAGALTGSLNHISAQSSEEELKGAIKEFEVYFAEQIIKKMKDTFTSIDGKDSNSTMSRYRDMYMDMTIKELAEQLVDDTGESLTQQLYEQMKRNYNIE